MEREYRECVSDLIRHPAVRSMARYAQHGGTDCLRHCLRVSYVSYRICKRMGLDYVSAARGGLLHDFFLYDWHRPGGCEGLHGFVHPRIALRNADKYFTLNKRERDIIRNHMWPLTVRLPSYRESYVVVAVDKYCALAETLHKQR